ncbi:MAG: anaerobic ribonucleoside-triphosphate reductase activating protein [Clostridiales bacterium]|nr:anaerobic ribonucleoside-triphosphate reductase activating protein [Clostridiales bacterium]
MIIQGLQKLTLLDYPENVACTVFTYGCNFRCPFCHNASLVTKAPEDAIPEDEIFSFLKTRQGLLDGVCITGGEPLLHKDIDIFISKIRDLGFKVKLDTNGSFPGKLKDIINRGLVNYVAMDIKSSLENYGVPIGLSDFDVSPIAESVDFLRSCGVEYEFRTTVVDELHSAEDFENIGKWLKDAPKYFLQKFVDSGDIISEGLHPCSKEKMQKYKDILSQYIGSVELRGVE